MSEISGMRARIGRQAAVYGFGIILGKALSFVSLPILTQLLTPADYGVIALIEMTFDMLTILAGSRLALGVFRYYHKAETQAAKHAVLTTALTLLFATYSMMGLAAWLSAPRLSQLIFQTPDYAPVIRIAALSFPWEGMIGVPLAFLRLRDRAATWVAIGLTKSLLQLAGVIILLTHFDMGVRGVFLSTLFANILVVSTLLVLLLRETGLRFSTSSARDLFRYGMPLVATQAATFFTTFGDRYFLQASWDQTHVGIYSLAYTFGFLLFTVGYTPFGSVWDPLRFEIANRSDRNAVFNRAFINMNLLLLSAAVAIGVLAEDLLRIMSDPAYWDAAALIPLVLVAYSLQGWSAFQEIGILVREQTRYITIANWAAALMAAVGYATLIPSMAGWGAATATVAAFGLRCILIYRFSQRLWPLRYDWPPVLRLVGLAAAAVAVATALPVMPLIPSLAFRALIGLAYIAAVWKSDIIPIEERDLLRGWVHDPVGAVRQISAGLKPRTIR